MGERGGRCRPARNWGMILIQTNRIPSAIDRVSVAVALAFVAVAGLSGCTGGGNDVRQFDLSGNVTFQGEPVPYGTIIFDPDRSAGNSGPQGRADIVDGKYDTSDGKGVLGGPYIAIINGSAEKPNVTDETAVTKELFPVQRRKVDLPKETTTMDFDIE